MNKEPEIQVGILATARLSFQLDGAFLMGGKTVSGLFKARTDGREITIETDSGILFRDDRFLFSPASADATFLLKEVTIGIDFHWEQKEDQRFRGQLELIVEAEKVRAVNRIPLEEYLCSVISSEMSATSSPELLKAHAVISRSWLLAQISKKKVFHTLPMADQEERLQETELIRWYDREDHTLFDVCADDHCQRYQGITRIISREAGRAIADTCGQVLFSDEKICDTRFSKCCGGISENFEKVWEPVPHRYLTAIRDASGESAIPDLSVESNAGHWIRSNPPAFCNTSDQSILSQVLPGFDQATTDFYRWKVTYTQEELSALIREKTGIDFGPLVKLEPVERGYSGRLVKLRICGKKKTLIIGKELEIRRALSVSHLYSSAFVVDHLEEKNGIPQKFVLTGAGWGHGVGLCQIGAAVMGEQGYNYLEILKHYFKDAVIRKLYS